MGIDQMIAHIKIEIKKAKTTQASLAQQMAELGKAIYPQIPHFQWQDRGGDSKYLFLTFRKTENGSYGGPDGKKKLYIGNDPEKILQAQQMAVNTINYKELDDTIRRLRWWISSREGDIEALHRKADRMLNDSPDWQDIRPKLFIWDGDVPGRPAGEVTN